MLTLTSPVETRAHRWPAAAKLAVLAGTTAGLFAVQGVMPMALALAGLLGLAALPGRAFLAHALRALRPLWPFVVVVAAWHLWSGETGAGAVVSLRMLAAVLAATLVTMTTRLSAMIAVIEGMARPLRRLGLSPRVLALAIALVIRFIPVLADRVEQIGLAFRARGARRPGWRVIAPAALAALDDADRVAEALRARGGAG